MNQPPCIRHGENGIEDARLLSALELAAAETGPSIRSEVALLTDFNGQLWAAWHDAADRDRHAPVLSRAWERVGGAPGALHLIRSEENFDYQEDCMNDAS